MGLQVVIQKAGLPIVSLMMRTITWCLKILPHAQPGEALVDQAARGVPNIVPYTGGCAIHGPINDVLNEKWSFAITRACDLKESIP